MTKIHLKKQLPLLRYIFIFVGTVFLVLGCMQSIPLFQKRFNPAFPGGDWNPIIYVVEGILFLSIGIYFSLRKKYFIRLGKEKLQLQIPQQASIQSIPWNEINHVHIGLMEIDVVTKQGEEKKIPLHEVGEFQKIKKINTYFEALKKDIETREEIEN
jgi:hypothetical protein